MAPITIIPKACSCCKGERSSRDKSSNLPLPNILYEGSEGGGLPLRAMSFISRLRRSRQHRVSIRSAYLVHPFPLRGTSPQGETRALRDWLSMSYGMTSILVIGSLRSPPPIRLRRTSPRESVSHDSQVALLPYESCSLATPVQGAE